MKNLSFIVLSFLFATTASVLAQDEVQLAQKDTTVQLAYSQMDKQRLVGAVDVVSGDDLRRSTHYKASNALPGLASGLYVSKGSADPGSTWTSLKVRGLSRGNDSDGPLVIVDGIPNRSLDNLSVEAIESITVLKDVTAKMLYGSQAANGVIIVNTIRGKVEERKLSFSVEGGIKIPTFVPEYLDAAQYAEKYNEARANDGLTPLYSQGDIDTYRDGSSPLTHPNEDYYNTYLKKSTNYQRVNTTLTGGDEGTRFFLNLDYVRESGLEAVGEGHQFNQLNLTSNLDYIVNDIISVNLNMASRFGLHSNSTVNGSELYGAMSSHRPNDYPFFVTSDQSVDTYQLGYNPYGDKNNLYGDLTRGGYSDGQDFQAQTTMGIDFNMDEQVKGLSASVKVGFDSYNSIYKGKELEYASYQVVTADSLVRINKDDVTGDEEKFTDDFTRNVAGYGNIKYDRTFGAHAVTADVNYSMSCLSYKSTVTEKAFKQDLKGLNVGGRLNYAYDNKYIVQFNTSYMGSDKFEPENRYKLYGAAGAAWVLSEESFLKDSEIINFLKVKSSYGKMGYDLSLDYYLYRNEYGGGGGYYFGSGNTNAEWGQKITQFGNPNITFEESTEFNVGVESRFLDNALRFEANYFTELREGMPVVSKSAFPAYVSSAATVVNNNSVSNKGVELALSYANNAGDLFYSVGANMIYSKSIYEAYDEHVLYDHLSRVGKATDVYLGLKAEGLYADQAAIDAHGVTSAYGSIQPGDIKYENYTNDLGDNLIDEYDKQEMGHTSPRINYAMNVNLEYKGFELYVLGQGIADVDVVMPTKDWSNSNPNTYFYNYGENKYSTQVLNSDYPRLTTNTSGGHSFTSSSYWMKSGAYFKLRNVELSYTLPSSVSDRINAQRVKVFVKGTDLFCISELSTVDPEDVNAGITKYPLFTTASLGAKVTF